MTYIHELSLEEAEMLRRVEEQEAIAECPRRFQVWRHETDCEPVLAGESDDLRQAEWLAQSEHEARKAGVQVVLFDDSRGKCLSIPAILKAKRLVKTPGTMDGHPVIRVAVAS